MSNVIQFPDAVSFFPMMGIQAARQPSARGGWRLYTLARALDENGTGREIAASGKPRTGEGSVSRELLRAWCEDLGLTPRQWQRWITEARNNDLLTDVQAKNGEWMLIITGLVKAAFALRCDSIGTHKVSMSPFLLFGSGWRANVWAAYEQTHNGRNISRAQLQKLTNVPVSTQRYRDAQAGVKRNPSYAKSEMRKDSLPGLIEFSRHKGVFIGSDGFIHWRLPDSRSVGFALRGGRGCSRKANKLLRSLWNPNGFSQMREALSEDNTNNSVCRLFNRTEKQFESTMKKLSKAESPHAVKDVYQYSRETKSGAVIWKHIPVPMIVTLTP